MMKSAVAAVLLLWPQGTAAGPYFDRSAMMAEAASDGFAAAEEKYLATAAEEKSGDLRRLAEFYMANALWPEALAVLRRIDAPGTEELAAECEYRLGRYDAVVRRLEGAPANALAPMALTRLGAYLEAREAFNKSAPPHASLGMVQDYLLAKAEAQIATGGAADAAFRAAGGEMDSRRRFLLARSYAVAGDARRALLSYKSASGGADEWAMRARLAVAEQAQDVSALEELSLQWQGGAFERDLQLALGRLRLTAADYDRAFAALHRVVDRDPRSDAAAAAADLIAGALPTLLADASEIDPKNAARLFFENVEFAPPGHEGDELIQEAVKKLEALGLYAQAALILDHQVMKRLRGAERALVAADLADLYLTAKKPAAALRILRSTRIAGLSAAAVEGRRRLEAQALAETGGTDAALALLGDARSADDLLLRAEINWSGRTWGAAASDYAAYVAAVPALSASREKTAAVRAATAFLLADDRAGYRAFAKEAALRLEGTPEAGLIATLGDVDREQFLAGFMKSYRSVYGADGS